jgi:hypothetical protein
MTRGTALAIGFFGGLAAGVFALLEVAPSVSTVLTMPLKWLLEDLHPFPSESPANLIIVWPLLFVYWGCLGMAVALLIRLLYRLICRAMERGKRNG